MASLMHLVDEDKDGLVRRIACREESDLSMDRHLSRADKDKILEIEGVP